MAPPPLRRSRRVPRPGTDAAATVAPGLVRRSAHRRRPSRAIAAESRSGRTSTARSPPDCCSPSAVWSRLCSGSRSPTSRRSSSTSPSRCSRALGLDPVLKWFERHNVKRPWAIAIVFLIFGVIGIGLLLARRADPDRPDQRSSSPASPTRSPTSRRPTSTRGWRASSAPGLTHAGQRARDVHHQPREHRRHLRWPAQDRRRHRHRRLGRPHRRRADPLLRRVAARASRSRSMQFAPARNRPKVRDHDQPDHRLGRRLPHGHGHPGVLQLRRRLPAAPRPRSCRTRC